MKKIYATAMLTAMAACGSINSLHAQNSSHYGGGLKFNFSNDNNHYVRFLLWNQIWARYNDNNPGTMVGGESAKHVTDIGARRIRLLAYAQISPKYIIVAHLGINNQTFLNGGGSGATGTGGYGAGKKPQIFFHEAYNEYTFIPQFDPVSKKQNMFSISIGAGLHYWNGLSRITSSSTVSMMTLDMPLFNWPTLENADQFGMQYGLYAKGVIQKLHYQVSANKPFLTDQTPAVVNVAVDNSNNTKAAFQGYFDYQFLEQEGNSLAYRVGTYLGTKKVFNIGAGFYSQADGTKSLNADGTTFSKHNVNHFSADAFLDMPVGNKAKKMAITAYGAYYNFNYGPNYLRSTGIMNLGTLNPDMPAADKVVEGAGNSEVLMGTGQIVYAQAGFLLPKWSDDENVRLQPYVAYTYKKLKALNGGSSHWDVGMNYYIDAHNAKITAQYSSRPLYSATTKEVTTRKGQVIVQFQIAI